MEGLTNIRPSNATEIYILQASRLAQPLARARTAGEQLPGERILDRRRRLIFFAPGAVFAFVRWQANDFGTVLSRIDIMRACGAGEPCATVARVLPAEKAGIVRRLQADGIRMAMVAMAVSVTAIFFNSLWGRPRLFFDAVLSVGQVAATTS